MGFAVNRYLKVWKVEETKTGNKNIQCSTSKKVKGENDTTTLVNDWSGFALLCGEAKGLDVKVGDSLIIDECEVTSTYDKEKKQTKVNYYVYKARIWEKPEEQPTDTSVPTPAPATPDAPAAIEEVEEAPFEGCSLDDISDELPFN